MTEFAIIDNGVIVAFRDFEDVPSLEGKPYRVILPVVTTNPPYNSATQIRTGPVVTIAATEVTRVWTVTDKSQAQLDAEAAQARADRVAGIEVASTRGFMHTYNAIRQLRGEAPATEQEVYDWLVASIALPAPPADISPVKRAAIVETPAIGSGGVANLGNRLLVADVNIASFPSIPTGVSYQTFTVTGLLVTDILVQAYFVADFNPAAIAIVPERVTAANSLRVRCVKITTGSATPAANQVLRLAVLR
jgi:hypothetical protein